MQKKAKSLYLVAVAGIAFFLSGCYSIYTTPDVVLPEYRLEGSVRVEGLGFQLLVPVAQSSTVGSSYGTVNPWGAGKTYSASGTSTSNTTYYEYKDSDIVTEVCRKYLEERGLNVRNETPDLILRGSIGPGFIDFSKLYIDLPINLFSITGMIGSTRQKNWCELRVYRTDGSFVKKYWTESSWNHIIWSPVPLLGIYGDVLSQNPAKSVAAAVIALQENMRDFVEDYHRGEFDRSPEKGEGQESTD